VFFLFIIFASRPAIVLATINNVSFFSRQLNGNWEYSIYLPPNYEQGDERYPVIYFMHGMYNNNRTFAANRFDRIITEAITGGRVQPFIMVFPNGFRYSWWVDSRRYGPLATAFTEDLIPHIEAEYRILANRNNRLIGGISMGGSGALLHGLTNPQLFSRVVLFSPAVYVPLPGEEWSNPRSYRANFRHNMVINNIFNRGAFGSPFNAQLWQDLSFLTLYPLYLQQNQRLQFDIFYGNRDGITDNATQNLIDFLREQNANLQVVTLDGGHTWRVWQEALRLLLTNELFN
ncbi:MAG: alpha/beta hydrolase-fold protein, partial [Spirochaetaceae bacterium]|nr:alpha/beta hydrolase-fold protein [Spirochaetaceae bacterium]